MLLVVRGAVPAVLACRDTLAVRTPWMPYAGLSIMRVLRPCPLGLDLLPYGCSVMHSPDFEVPMTAW